MFVAHYVDKRGDLEKKSVIFQSRSRSTSRIMYTIILFLPWIGVGLMVGGIVASLCPVSVVETPFLFMPRNLAEW